MHMKSVAFFLNYIYIAFELDGITYILPPLRPSWDQMVLPLLRPSWDQTEFHTTTVDVSCA